MLIFNTTTAARLHCTTHLPPQRHLIKEEVIWITALAWWPVVVRPSPARELSLDKVLELAIAAQARSVIDPVNPTTSTVSQAKTSRVCSRCVLLLSIKQQNRVNERATTRFIAMNWRKKYFWKTCLQTSQLRTSSQVQACLRYKLRIDCQRNRQHR